jgi:hypothetical protein
VPDAGPDGGGTDDGPGVYDSVDLLLVVDDSGSMGEEQDMLATSLFTLLNSLVEPLPGSPHPALDNLRVAVVSTDMGLQWGGNPFDPDNDGWPYSTPPCSSVGDNGAFQTYPGGKLIDLEDGVIPCEESGEQCPIGWTCEDVGSDDIGACAAPGGDGDDQPCPTPPTSFTFTNSQNPNPNLAFQVACLCSLGTSGCGFEQQLEAPRRALTRQDQQTFVRDDALLAVMVVSDEEDCSIEDGPELFESPEIADVAAGKINTACGENEQFLYEATSYRDSFADLKNGDEQAVLFAAIVGVPPGAVCEGTGDKIGDCLDHEDMQLVVQEESYNQFFFRPACYRYDGEAEVTKARPGRRFVALAEEFGEAAYVYSICNEHWGAAMEEFAGLIFARLEPDD